MSDKDLSESVGSGVERLWRYLKSWQTADGRFGGMIATWWSSSVETAVPHPMNQFPIILGLLHLHRAKIQGGDWLGEARKVGQGLAESVDEEGLMENCWGDIPGRGTGPVFFTSCIRALCALHQHDPNPLYRDAILKMDRLVTERWVRGDQLIGCLVSNQVLSWAWSKLYLAELLEDPSLSDMAHRIALNELAHQIQSGPLAGGFYQGRFDDRLISIYVGKCIQPLLEIGRAHGDDRLKQAAVKAAQYLLAQEITPGIWINYNVPDGSLYHVARQFTRLDRKVFRATLPIYRLRRFTSRYRKSDYPSWYARAADPVRALWELSLDGLFDRREAERYTHLLLGLQYEHGGFPNTVGFFGDPKRQNWQDAACCTRWNAYVFYLLCRIAEILSIKKIDVPPSPFAELRIPLHGSDMILIEQDQEIRQEDSSTTYWRLSKPDGRATLVHPDWKGDLSGPRDIS